MTTRPRSSHAILSAPAPLLARSLLVAALVLITGCNIVAPAYMIIHGPEKVPAQHELEKERPTVIFIDDRANRLPRRTLRQTIGEAAQEALLKNKALTDVIDTRGALAVSNQDRAGQAMSIVDIGKAVKAEVVVYATVDAFTLSSDGQSFSPTATLRVKVIDVIADKRVWPEEKEGYPLALTFPTRVSDIPDTATEIRQREEETAILIGQSLAQLFHEYERAQDAGRQ